MRTGLFSASAATCRRSSPWRRCGETRDRLSLVDAYRLELPLLEVRGVEIEREDVAGPRRAGDATVVGDRADVLPVDFEAGPVQDVLGAAGFDWAQPALFCWTGVAPYLTAQAIESTLHTIAAAAPGSEVVFSYLAEDAALDDAGTEYARIYTPIAASVGEPLQPGWPVSEIERLVSRCGLKVVDHPARADLQQRYFAGRADGLRPSTFETLVAARVT